MSSKRIVVLTSLLLCSAASGDPIRTLTFRTLSQVPFTVRIPENRATVVVFVSIICPMSIDYLSRLQAIHDEYSQLGVSVLLVDSNSNDSDSEVEQHIREAGLHLPIYRDPKGTTASILGAFATPTAVVLDSRGEIKYWGSVDDSRVPFKSQPTAPSARDRLCRFGQGCSNSSYASAGLQH